MTATTLSTCAQADTHTAGVFFVVEFARILAMHAFQPIRDALIHSSCFTRIRELEVDWS